MAILGILFGISLSILFASFGIIVFSLTGAIRSSLLTGAVIGTTGVISYAIIAFVLSLIAVFFFMLILKKPHKEISEYYK